jgi:hypothetical protein
MLLTMLNERCLNLRSRQSVSRNVNNVINTASDPVVAFVIASGTVSSELP